MDPFTSIYPELPDSTASTLYEEFLQKPLLPWSFARHDTTVVPHCESERVERYEGKPAPRIDRGGSGGWSGAGRKSKQVQVGP